eukprot:m.37385 g.37385  ORF g.37385 m.37385 type:complete len:77 (+) comp12497_c0_seq5:419-649(+)
MSVIEEARSGKNYLHGSDKHGRPVIYQRPRRQNTKTYDLQVKQMAYLLERSVTSMDSSKSGYAWINTLSKAQLCLQ